MNTHRNKLDFPLLAFTILVIVTLACGSSAATSAPKVSTATSESKDSQLPAATAKPDVSVDTPVPTDTPVPPATELYLGDAVSDYGYALTAISVQDPAIPGMFYTATSGKKLIGVEVVICNISGDMLSANPLYATLIDMDGFTYKAELGGVDDQMSSLDLSPGERIKGVIPFEVPDNTVAASIKYSLEVFGSKLLQASLAPAPEGHVAVPEPPSTTGNPLPKLGDVVENFGYSLSAVTVEDPATPGMFYTPKQGYKLVAVEIVLGNVSGSETLSVNALYTYLVDSNGFVYDAELGGKDDQINTIDLAIGEKAKGWVTFTIPENASPVSIKYSTKIFSGNYLHTGLTK